MYCPWTAKNSKIILARYILLKSKSRTPHRASLIAFYLDLQLSIRRDGLLHTSIYDKRDDFNVHITNVPFQSSNIPSHRPIVFLSLRLYDTSGCAYHMNVLFWGPGDFIVSYSTRDTSWNAWNRHLGSFMVDKGILFSNMKSPSHKS